MRVSRQLLTVLATLVLEAAWIEGRLAAKPLEEGDIVIDGKKSTIGLTASRYFAGDITEPFNLVIDVIINVLTPPTPEEDIDYFELIKEDVETVVGTYINELNMAQLEVYKDDLTVLMKRYSEAPVESDTYPDKNTQANSLSISIVANRYLIEAVEWPHSMMLHYADIASIHLMVLQDVAETYTEADSTPSRWWVDLDKELEHYITFGRTLQDTVVDWRNDMLTCSYEECAQLYTNRDGERVCFDVWTMEDKVAELTDSCKVVHGTAGCEDHCQAYQLAMNREVAWWVYDYLGRVLQQWETLKLLSSKMAAMVEGGH